jgi:hypothetical protein
MSYIEVDARGCGVGKTRYTIIPRIRTNIRERLRTLVVVPSKELQKEYATHFDVDEITVINADTGRIYEQYQTAHTPVVCITHQGFLQTPHYLFEKENWDLIIDEALDPYSSLTFTTNDSAGRVWIRYDELVEWRESEWVPDFKPTTNPQRFFELKFCESTAPDVIDRGVWQKLSNLNYRKWSTWETGTNLMNNSVETATIQFELDLDTLRGWTSVWIAAAAFEKTFMGYWLRDQYEIVYPFERHTAPAVWHIPSEEFSWSKHYKNKNTDVEPVFRTYVDQNRNGRLIYNSNNDCTTVMPFGDRITHNAHGINRFKHRTDYAFMSAIKPHPLFSNFIRQRLELSKVEFEFAFAGYTAYQLLMRTALRDPLNEIPVNLFFLDTDQALSCQDLFDPNTYETRLITTIQGNKKSVALTSAERNKRWRERQKQLKAIPRG